MTPTEFQRIGEQMYGRKHWRSEYASQLSLDPSTVWRYSTSEADIPGVVAVAVRGLLAEHQYRKRVERYARKQIASNRRKHGLPPEKRIYHKRRIVVYKSKDLENEIADTAPDAPHDGD